MIIIMKIRKISIVGMPGSGKTTLAKQIQVVLNIPVCHLDNLRWENRWKLRSKKEFMNDLQEVFKQDYWIIEGASHSTLEIRYSSSDLVIYLNPLRFICCWRVFKRVCNRSQPNDKPDGCREKINSNFMKYLWRFRAVANQQINLLNKQYPKVQLLEINNTNNLYILNKLLPIIM